MTRDVVSPKIFEKIISSPHVKHMNPNSVRNAISNIHKDNPGITMNAAAYEFAKRKGVGVFRYLSQGDKMSRQHLKPTIPPEAKAGEPRTRGVVVKEIKPDFESPFIKEANDNAKIYPYIYILENTLRNVIFEKFGKSLDWWKNKTIVSEDIQNYAAKIRQAEQKYPWVKDRGDHPIYYVGLLELFKIVERSWNSHFREVFRDLEQLRAWVKESVPIRNLVAHNVKARDQDRHNIKRIADYICTLVERWHKKRRQF